MRVYFALPLSGTVTCVPGSPACTTLVQHDRAHVAGDDAVQLGPAGDAGRRRDGPGGVVEAQREDQPVADRGRRPGTVTRGLALLAWAAAEPT